MLTTLTRILCLVTAIGLAACEQANIVAPTDNAVATTKPASFQIAFPDGKIPATLSMQLNSTDVTDLFTVTEAGASADGSLLADYVYSGRNLFRVATGTQMKQVVFYYDTTGPAIHILAADRDTQTVTGYVSDPAGIAAVSLDGVALTLDANNRFTTSYNDQAFNRFEAIDNFNQTSTTTFARNDNTFNGLSAYLSQSGLDFLTPILEQTLSGADMAPILAALGPVTITIPDLGMSVDVEITDLYMENLDLGLNLQPSERLDVGLYAENMVVGLQLSNIDYVLDIFGLLRGLEVGAVVNTTDDGGGNNYLDVVTLLAMSVNNGDIDLDTNNTDLNVSGLDIQLDATGIALFDNIASVIVDALLDVMLSLFNDLITTLVDYLIMPLVSEFLSELSIGVSLENIDGNGANIDFTATPDYLNTTATGLSVRLATNASAPTPPATVPTALGSLYVDGIAPIMPATTPDGSTFDFGVALSANVLNQILVAAHDSGLTTMELGPGFYQGSSTLNDAILEGDLVGIRITPASAPYVTLGNAEGAAGTLYWYDLTVSLDLYRESWGEYRTIFGATINVEVPFEINSTFGGYLALSIEQLPIIEVTQTDASGILPLPASFINSTVEYVIPMVLPLLANQLQVIPLPSIFDHTLFMEEFWVEGGSDSNNTLALAGKLIPIALVQNAAAPTTNIDDVTYRQTTVEMESVTGGIVSTNSVTLNNGAVNIRISGTNPNPEYGGLQYRFKIDGGGWSAWKERSSIDIDSFLAGDHSVRICSRSALMKEETDCPVVEFTTTVAE